MKKKHKGERISRLYRKAILDRTKGEDRGPTQDLHWWERFAVMVSALALLVSTVGVGITAYQAYLTREQLTAADRNRAREGVVVAMRKYCSAIGEDLSATRKYQIAVVQAESDLPENENPALQERLAAAQTLRGVTSEFIDSLDILAVWGENGVEQAKALRRLATKIDMLLDSRRPLKDPDEAVTACYDQLNSFAGTIRTPVDCGPCSFSGFQDAAFKAELEEEILREHTKLRVSQ